MTRTVLFHANGSPEISRRGAFEIRANRLISSHHINNNDNTNWGNTSAAALSFEPPPRACVLHRHVINAISWPSRSAHTPSLPILQLGLGLLRTVSPFISGASCQRAHRRATRRKLQSLIYYLAQCQPSILFSSLPAYLAATQIRVAQHLSPYQHRPAFARARGKAVCCTAFFAPLPSPATSSSIERFLLSQLTSFITAIHTAFARCGDMRGLGISDLATFAHGRERLQSSAAVVSARLSDLRTSDD
jgi:hypothetical protein